MLSSSASSAFDFGPGIAVRTHGAFGSSAIRGLTEATGAERATAVFCPRWKTRPGRRWKAGK